MLPHLAAGVWKHYKGPMYLVLGYGHDANADTLSVCPTNTREEFYQAPLGERVVVVYVGLTLDEAHTGPRLAVRTADDFLALVCVEQNCSHYGQVDIDRSCYGCGHTMSRRFTYVGPTWEG